MVVVDILKDHHGWTPVQVPWAACRGVAVMGLQKGMGGHGPSPLGGGDVGSDS